jgi:hypothetical protein
LRRKGEALAAASAYRLGHVLVAASTRTFAVCAKMENSKERKHSSTMKTISRLLPVSILLLAMVSAQEALAGGCNSNRCPAYVAPYVPPAPATASASRGFTAIGGTRVADVNLSQEGLARLNAGDKEEPLPKGCSTAADRAKLATRQPPLDGWPQNEIPSGSRNRVRRSLLRGSVATRVLRNSLLKPREAKPFTRRSAARPVKPATIVKVKSSGGQSSAFASRQ